ncbi:hypothetical protein SCB71_06380 [Herbiconiux sp. KACC 21604]|uniref:hypothetical protein n=1 Tax=unclassified Herbiconiux TaxID=2618217 RepID=UPI00149291EC|nr:hypothetical protein [Herbiconiux sp. SALV-R1]QJU52943.1 hypothetical protein HL652_04365 [Herbiconiux sp. SALV-R1]WPO87865.1 hypothetical protein SCB71_06380 [Herbiconiux sp. KACC 21604]
MSDNERDELGFVIEDRAGIDVLVYENGSCRPAQPTEVKMWRALVSRDRRMKAEGAAVEMDALADRIYETAPWVIGMLRDRAAELREETN